ncbi:hypothetical protein [Caulobacter mirabilis]|uniref:Uncharacterized protein n=1 Tax=Caulobacter mirabilis TaxID=69666 RepID=A0A2D2ATT3_9CAUL|nr:hypothetical protein [Caulobacter mirabilis]ATQ41422.1 hypothetical protein CSW64_02825 [Caulobacter mirabilis]
MTALPAEGKRRRPGRAVVAWLLGGVTAVGVLMFTGLLVFVGGIGIVDDFTSISQNAGRFGLYTDDEPIRSDPTFYITHYRRSDPSRFVLVVRQADAPPALARSIVTAEIRSGPHVARGRWTCGPDRPAVYCHPTITAATPEPGTATIAVVDYDAAGREIGRASHAFEVRRERRIVSRLWEVLMSV